VKNKYDLLKVFAILLVVLGHVTNHYMEALPTKAITITIYLFHMSLFVALSGAVFQMGLGKGKYREFLPFFVTKAKRLIVPFCMTTLLVLAPTLVFCGKTDLGYIGTVVNIFVGGEYVKHLWYLQALFWIFLVCWVAFKLNINRYALLIVAFILSIAVSLSGVDMNKYLSVGMAINKLPMFVLGMILASSGERRGRVEVAYWIVVCLLFGSIQIISKSFCVDCIVYQLFSVSIVGLIVSLSNVAYVRLKDSRILSFIVRNSFGIYLFHMTPIYLIRYWGCDTWSLWLSVPVTFVFALIASIALTILFRASHIGILIGEK
jgi:hypothetical protein